MLIGQNILLSPFPKNLHWLKKNNKQTSAWFRWIFIFIIWLGSLCFGKEWVLHSFEHYQTDQKHWHSFHSFCEMNSFSLLANVSATNSGNIRVASPYTWKERRKSKLITHMGHPGFLIISQSSGSFTLTGLAVFLIFPQETASSGLAPASLPSNSAAVFTNTLKSAPFLWKVKIL